MFGRRRPRTNGAMSLSAAFVGDQLFARVTLDATRDFAPPFSGDFAVASPSELRLIQQRLTNWCHEHRVQFAPGDFRLEHPKTNGAIPAAIRLVLGDETTFFLAEIGEGTRTFSYREGLAHYERMCTVTSDYLRACGVTTADVVPIVEGDVHRELADEYAMRGRYGFLGALCSSYVDSEVTLRPTNVVVSHTQTHHFEVRQPCETLDDLRASLERFAIWSETNDARLTSSTLGFIAALPDEWLIDMPSFAPRDWDQERQTVEWLAHVRGDDRLLFRVVSDAMAVGIASAASRVWLLLEPKVDRVVKSSDEPYTITADELERIRRAADVRGEVLRELERHLE